MNQKRKRYTQEFKDEAVKLITDQGYAIAEVARNLGLNPGTVCRWRKQIEESSSPEGIEQKALQVELNRLRKENKRLKLEREILKKATAFFAKESS